MQHHDLVACVLEAHAVLGRESDLSPSNPRINAALSALVRRVLQGGPPDDEQRVLTHPGVSAIRGTLVRRLALAEGAMERHWAEAFCQRAHLAAADLSAFTYWDCYHHLVQAELDSLAPRLRLDRGESIAFVGAGPLPLSAIIMHARTGLPVICIDVDPQACRLAGELCRKADMTGVQVVCVNGTHHDYAPHPIAIVASLLPEKAQVIRRIGATRPHAVVAVRSVEGLCTLLYDAVDETELMVMGCGYLGRTGCNPHTINTTLLYEAAPADAGSPRRSGGIPLDVATVGAPAAQ